MIINTAGRNVPESIFGTEYHPYTGAFNISPFGNKYGRKYNPHLHTPKSKRVFDDFEKTIKHIGLKDGMTIGFIHNLRYGDLVICYIMDTIAGMGIKNLTLASTALFPNHEPLLGHIESGVINRIEGSMNGPIGRAVSSGVIKIPTILRSHGGRARAVETGDLHLDVSFIAAPAVDELGNMNGCQGPSAYGACGFANETDAVYADTVVLVTDNLLTNELVYPVSIRGSNVDYIVTMDRIGDPNKILTGSLARNVTGKHYSIAKEVIQIAEMIGYLKEGFSFQAGAGGVSLAATQFLREKMIEKQIKGSFIHGGITASCVELLESDLFYCIYDGQSFDPTAAKSLQYNPKHIESSAQSSYNMLNPGGPIANYVDIVALGATEVDINFNVNVNTHSDGLLLHGIGGHTDAAAARLTIITCPIARKVPTILDRVTTISTPGEMIDVVITDAGIAINPRRKDLRKKLEKKGLDIKPISELRDIAYSEAAPITPDLSDEICTVIEYRDGTILDVVYRLNV